MRRLAACFFLGSPAAPRVRAGRRARGNRPCGARCVATLPFCERRYKSFSVFLQRHRLDFLDSSATRVARQPRAAGARLARLLIRFRYTFSGRFYRRLPTFFVTLFMVRRVFGCNHKKSVELFRFRAFPWDTAGGQLGCPSPWRLGHHARPFVTKFFFEIRAAQNCENLVDLGKY